MNHDLSKRVRLLLQLSSDLLLEQMRYDGGVEVEVIEQRVRGIGEDLSNLAKELQDWYG